MVCFLGSTCDMNLLSATKQISWFLSLFQVGHSWIVDIMVIVIGDPPCVKDKKGQERMSLFFFFCSN